jgi:hypothetical protein
MRERLRWLCSQRRLRADSVRARGPLTAEIIVIALRQLASKWSRCSLAAKHPRVRFEVLDASFVAG